MSPAQIEALLAHNTRLCAAFGMGHERWDLLRAEAFLAESYPEYLEIVRAVPHPAMGSDLLRLCILARHGGLYLDADMALREAGVARLAGLLHEGLVFKWNLPDRQNVPNWCFGFRAGHPMLEYLVHETAAAIATGLAGDRAALGRDILNASGPGRFTRALGSWLARHGCPPGFAVLDVDEAYKMVQNGPELLKAPLAYKTTALHWLVAAAREGGADD